MLKPGVYLLHINNVEQKPGVSNPDTTVTHVSMVVKDGEFKDVPIKTYLAESAAGMAVGFVEAVLGKKLPEDGINLTPEMLLKLIGRDVKAAIKPKKSDKYGMQNDIEGFMPV